MKINELLYQTVHRDASDLHLTAGCPAMLRIHGQLIPLDKEVLSAVDIQEIILPVLSAVHKERLENKRAVDLSYIQRDMGRFRLNVFYQRGDLSCAIRRLYDRIFSLTELGLPSSLVEFAEMRDGLVVVTGPTGCGKSTTLATLIDLINRTRSGHIITLEDPIEYFHDHQKSIVNQRELYADFNSFAEAMRDSLREDPDVILVGEMRDLDTMRTALTAAETGHLVLSTLHTRDTVSTIARILGIFPSEEQAYIRQQLSEVLRGVVSQRLLTCSCNKRRKPCLEIMKVTKGIGNLIRSGKTEQIYSAIETGGNSGMQTMEQALIYLFQNGDIDQNTAQTMSKNAELIRQRIFAI